MESCKLLGTFLFYTQSVDLGRGRVFFFFLGGGGGGHAAHFLGALATVQGPDNGVLKIRREFLSPPLFNRISDVLRTPSEPLPTLDSTFYPISRLGT